MNRPGFALLSYGTESGKLNVVRMSNIDNKTLTANRNKPHGQKLGEIASELRKYFVEDPSACIVREEALANISTSAKTIQVLHKVVGVTDLYAWAFGGKIFDEISPKTVKKLITGDANAEKYVVAKCLDDYVGPQKYACDDESDAVAVGVAWLIERGYLKAHE